jgi:glycosyltransferase involved in cell wall biosynthesis
LIKFSFVTVNYNNADGLASTLESYELLKSMTLQQYSIELVVIDGLSDNEDQVVLNSKLSLMDAFVSEKDFGIYDAMNKGVYYATGDFICFMNSGDRIEPVGMNNFLNAVKDKSSWYIGSAKWTSKFVMFKRFEFSPFLLRMPNHQAMMLPTNFLRLHPFNVNYPIAADLDNKLFACKELRRVFLDYIVVSCSPGGKSQTIEDYTNLFSRSYEIGRIAFVHFGLFVAVVNVLKYLSWHGFVKLLAKRLRFKKSV